MIRRRDYKGDEYHRIQAAAHQKLYRQRKWKWLKGQLGDCCSICGATDRLELDHIDPSLKKYKGRTIIKSYKDLSEEIDNLRILCHDCHCDNTAEQIRNGEIINGYKAKDLNS